MPSASRTGVNLSGAMIRTLASIADGEAVPVNTVTIALVGRGLVARGHRRHDLTPRGRAALAKVRQP